MTDDEEIHALQRSLYEPAAFGLLFERHHLAVRRCLTPAWATRALRRISLPRRSSAPSQRGQRFRDQGHGIRAWLFQIATNLLRDELRTRGRQARKRQVVREPVSAAPPGLPADPGLSAQLRALPPQQLEVLLLYAWADLSYEEIAVALGIRAGTVRSRLHRARGQMQKTLTPTTDPERLAVRVGRSRT